MSGFALRIDFVPWQPLQGTAAAPSCLVWFSDPQIQGESEVMQLGTSTTWPQSSVLVLVIICSYNDVGVRAVTLCGLDLPLNHTVKGNDAISTQHWRTSLPLSLFTFSLLPFKHLSIWCYVFCLRLRFCHRKMPIQSIIRCLPNSYLMITFPIPISYHSACYSRQVRNEVTFPMRTALKNEVLNTYTYI